MAPVAFNSSTLRQLLGNDSKTAVKGGTLLQVQKSLTCVLSMEMNCNRLVTSSP